MGLKTYTVSGLMDWEAEIRAGKGRVKIHFTGGAMTAYGVTPAEYSTRDPFVQTVIERSEYFKEGRIRLHKEYKEEGVKNASQKTKSRGKLSSPPTNQIQAPDTEGDNIPDTEGDNIPDTEREISVENEEPEDGGGESEVRVKVSCLTEAQNYLKDHFGIATSRSRSRERAHELALQNGVIFEGLG